MKKAKLLFPSIALLLTGCSAQSHSVGMIGGADGPTVILITGNPFLAIGLPVAGVAVLIAAVVFVVKKRNRKK